MEIFQHSPTAHNILHRHQDWNLIIPQLVLYLHHKVNDSFFIKMAMTFGSMVPRGLIVITQWLKENPIIFPTLALFPAPVGS